MKKETKNSIRETFREYYEDVLTHIYGDKKEIDNFYTYQEDDLGMPLRMASDIIVDGKVLSAILEYRNWGIKGYESNNGMYEIDISGSSPDDEKAYLVNPTTAEVDNNLSKEEQNRFYKELSRWPELCEKDIKHRVFNGHTEIPDPTLVVFWYIKNKRLKENIRLRKEVSIYKKLAYLSERIEALTESYLKTLEIFNRILEENQDDSLSDDDQDDEAGLFDDSASCDLEWNYKGMEWEID